MGIITTLISKLCSLYSLVVIVYCVLSWIRVADNQWTVLIKRMVEPVLTPIRNLLDRVLPASVRMIDFSPWVLLILIRIVRYILIDLLTF